MAYRRKRKPFRSKVSKQIIPNAPEVEDFLDEQKTTYLTDVIKTFGLDKYPDLSWSIRNPDSLASGIQAPVKFLHNTEKCCVHNQDSLEERLFILIGQLVVQGHLNGVSDFANSVHVTQPITLRLTTNGRLSLCILVTLPTVTGPVPIVVTTPVSICIDQNIFADISSYCRRGLIQLRVQGLNQCNQLEVFVYASGKFLNMGGADDLLTGRNMHSLKENMMLALVNSVKSSAELNSHSEVTVDTNSDHISSVKDKIFQFYKWVYSNQRPTLPKFQSLPADIPGLTATLHRYQMEAVQWMLSKEQAEGWSVDDGRGKLHPLWQEIKINGQDPFYYNCYTGKLSFTRYPVPLPAKGGILADEMGLGKTVEILALILIHKSPLVNRDELVSAYLQSLKNDIEVNRMECDIVSSEPDVGVAIIEYEPNRQTASNTYITEESDNEITSEPVSITDDHTTNSHDSISYVPSDNNDTRVAILVNDIEKKLENGDMETDDVVEPNVEDGDMTDDIWCLCGANTVDGRGSEMVQCDLCRVWQHSKCADFVLNKDKDFICVRCLMKKPISCSTTLIIVPESLLCQWREEIAKHTDIESLRIVKYWGVSHRYINPLHIISNDIILVSYETLRKELARVHHHEFTLTLRKRKLNAYPPSPLLAINWWRVCLDEAQTVECVTGKYAEMTHKLTAVNRWCVTGTPVHKDLHDLYGLVYFLGYRPYCIRQWWLGLIWRSYCHGNPQPMVSLFSDLMWRNSKKDVADELCLPELKEEIHWLTFTAVEDYFYKKQEEMCKKDFFNVLLGLTFDCSEVSLSDLHHSLVTKLLNPLHTLRKACCHPQLVKKGYITLNVNRKSYHTMSDLLEKLFVQAKFEGREDLRELVANLNGQAAIYIIQKNFQMAVDTYRKAMFTWKKYADKFACDKMQRIHTMENLAFLLEEGHSSLSKALSDDQLKEEAAILRREYMKNQENQVTAGVQSLSIAAATVRKTLNQAQSWQLVLLGKTVQDDVQSDETISSIPAAVLSDNENEDNDLEIEDEESNNDMSHTAAMNDIEHFNKYDLSKTLTEFWWFSAIAWVKEMSRDEELQSALETELHTSLDYFQQLSFFDFRDLSGLELSILNHFNKIQMQRALILKNIDQLSAPGPLSNEILQRACQCHLRTNRINPSSPCDYCQTECEIKTYEGLLFSRYSIRNEDIQRDTSRNMSICEKLLKTILTFIHLKRAPEQLCKAGNALLKYFESLRKESKHILKLWVKAEQRVRACDELSMAATRFTVLKDGENSTATTDISMDSLILKEYEVGPKLLEFTADAKMAQSKLQKSYGQLMYLCNLRSNDAKEIQSCPICTTEFENQWSVLPCGHSLCVECLNTLMKRHIAPVHYHTLGRDLNSHHHHAISFSCPMCRERVNSDNIHYIHSNDSSDEGCSVQLTGSYSTKVKSVVSILKMIKLREPYAKSLVFSSTIEVLKLIGHALKENEMECAFLQSKTDYWTSLQQFKTSPTLNILLVPMSSGSKGLNIIEATHLLLVEPSLNVGAELQAIGRIHRVGQTKETTVHRFYVRKSIEQSIKTLMSSSSSLSNFISTSSTGEKDCSLTVRELQNLFC